MCRRSNAWSYDQGAVPNSIPGWHVVFDCESKTQNGPANLGVKIELQEEKCTCYLSDFETTPSVKIPLKEALVFLDKKFKTITSFDLPYSLNSARQIFSTIDLELGSNDKHDKFYFFTEINKGGLQGLGLDQKTKMTFCSPIKSGTATQAAAVAARHAVKNAIPVNPHYATLGGNHPEWILVNSPVE